MPRTTPTRTIAPLATITPMQARALRQVQLHHAALLLARHAATQAQQTHVASKLRNGASLGPATVPVRRRVAARAARAHAHAQAQVRQAQAGYSAALRAATQAGIPAHVARRTAHALGMASVRAW